MTVQCDHCDRTVPVAPHFKNVSVAHVRCDTHMKERYMDGDVEVREWKPCVGNTERAYTASRSARGGPTRGATRGPEQRRVLE